MSNNIMFFTFEAYHAKRDTGSTRIRVYNLLKHWPEATLYQYGLKPDVMVFQKVYSTFDYKYPINLNCLKILDICDPDFKDTPDIFIKETMDAMDAVVAPTETLRDFLQQMTDTPVRVIKDRFDLDELPEPKNHKGTAKTAVWFGYAHNAESIKFAVPSLEARGIELLVVSNEDPNCYRWANQPEEYKKKYTWVKYSHPDAYHEIQKADMAVLVDGYRPMDIFKSENKSVIAQLLGIPIAKNSDDLDRFMDPEERNKTIKSVYGKLREEYDCRVSVKEYKELIRKIRERLENGKRRKR